MILFNRRPIARLFFSALLVLSSVTLARSTFAQDPGRRSLRLDRAGIVVPDRAAAKTFIESRRSELALGTSSLSAGRTTESAASGRLLRAHHFEQVFAGLPVEDSDLVVLTDGSGKILLAEAKTGSDARANPVPRISAASAIDAVLGTIQGKSPVSETDLALSLVFRRKAFDASPQDGLHLYWKIEVTAGGDAGDGEALGRVVYLDAESSEARVAYQSPTSCGGDTKIEYITNNLPVGDADASYAIEGQANVEVMFFCAWGGTAGPIISGPGGLFSLPVGFTCIHPQFGPGAINIAARYGSVMPDINLWQGYGPLPAMSAAAGGGPPVGNVPVHPTGGGVILPGGPVIDPLLVGSGAQVLHWHQALRDYLAAYPIFLGGAVVDAEVDISAFSVVAVASPANGLWRVRYGQGGVPAGSSTWQANSASSTIILHELGHICWWRSTPAGVWWDPDSKAINEAVGDALAMFVTDQPLVGHAWLGTGTGAIRTGGNAHSHVALDPEGNEHGNGEILMGSLWKMRQNLGVALGAANGNALAKTLLLDWLTLFDDVDMDSSILAHLLVLDDNDGDLTNGTPNAASIVGGFAAHGWPAADPALYGAGSNPIFGAQFFDLDAGTGRLSKLALYVLDPTSAATPVVIVAGTPGAMVIPGLGTTAFDPTLPFFFLVDGITPGAGIFPIFPASTDTLGVFRDREPIVPVWPPGIIIAMQAFVLDPAAPLFVRMSNGFNIALP